MSGTPRGANAGLHGRVGREQGELPAFKAGQGPQGHGGESRGQRGKGAERCRRGAVAAAPDSSCAPMPARFSLQPRCAWCAATPPRASAASLGLPFELASLSPALPRRGGLCKPGRGCLPIASFFPHLDGPLAVPSPPPAARSMLPSVRTRSWIPLESRRIAGVCFLMSPPVVVLETLSSWQSARQRISWPPCSESSLAPVSLR